MIGRRWDSDWLFAVLDDARPVVRFLVVLAIVALTVAIGLALLVTATGLARAIGPLAGTAVFLAALAALCVWFVKDMR